MMLWDGKPLDEWILRHIQDGEGKKEGRKWVAAVLRTRLCACTDP